MNWNDGLLTASGFYGRVVEREGEWFGTRSGDSRVPPLGPFDSLEEAQECVESYARAHLEWLVRTGMEPGCSGSSGAVGAPVMTCRTSRSLRMLRLGWFCGKRLCGIAITTSLQRLRGATCWRS